VQVQVSAPPVDSMHRPSVPDVQSVSLLQAPVPPEIVQFPGGAFARH
jgi:hypothetical protein